MTHIKRLVMHGFKSFASKTEVVFDKGINVVIGPNGSGKSNISDALCFVLGRLSTKSIRAAKAKNLMFMGSKYVKPAREAVVQLAFDNTDRSFPLDQDEVVLSRSVRHNGSSVYKINEEVKTRSDIIELLAQAGIDPHGFNLVLQGQIQAVVRMHPEDRRKVVEEVAGISIYESRKEKSLHELEKTDEKLKEINAILRERTAFLRNLENERSQALKFKDLELTIKRCKASIIQKRAEDKIRELGSIKKSIEDKTSHKDSLKNKADEVQKQVDALNERIIQINKHIQHSTGIEQDTLHTQIANLKAEIEGIKVRRENLEHRKAELERRAQEIMKSIPEHEKEISELRIESPLVAKKQAELAKKKQDLAKIEEERKKIYTLKTEHNSLKDRIRDKESQRSRITGESDAVLKQIEEYSVQIKHHDANACKKSISELLKSLEEKRKSLNELSKVELESAKSISSFETEIRSWEKIKSQVSSLDTCPLCQNKITSDHIHHVTTEANSKINDSQKKIKDEGKTIDSSKLERDALVLAIRDGEKAHLELEKELSRHYILNDKKDYLKRLVDQDKILEVEIKSLNEKRDALQQKTQDVSRMDELYSTTLMEIEEISSRTEEDLDQTLMYKERDLEKMRELIKIGKRDKEQIESEILDFTQSFENKSSLLEKKEKEEIELNERFKKLFKERDESQEQIQKASYEISEFQGQWRQIEDQINYLKVGNAKLEAEKEALEMEMQDYAGAEIIKASLQVLEEKLQKAQSTIHTIGSINLRALEIYDEIKQEYDRVSQKVEILQKEKEEILKIIEEIDNKKKRTFMKTFNQINELFSTNFSKLSTKGQAFLELENPEDLFSGGVSIVIRMAKGKYFDVTSLSGGEQTLVALSLLFAIQEYKPYHFYIFDEIDAALDKRNSERLSALLKQYMRSGQYITITHNDAIITDANVLYGVSMHDGVSKILSLNLGDKPQVQSDPRPPEETEGVSQEQTSN